MGKQIKTLRYKFQYTDKTITGEMTIDLSRFEGQYSKAQYELDSMVMTSMIPFMPMKYGVFINVTQGLSQSIAGSGKVVAAAPPFGRFLYEGKVMIGERSMSAFAMKGEKKIATDRDLNFSKQAHPKVSAHWFESAKESDGKEWIAKTKKLAGGG